MPHLPKAARYTLGLKLDKLILEVTENILMAAGVNSNTKLNYLYEASGKLDLAKFFLKMAWEIKVLPDKKFLLLSGKLVELGKMIGGWIKKTKTP